MNLKPLKTKLLKILGKLPLETDCFVTQNNGIKYLYLHFKDRDDEFSAAKAAKYTVNKMKKGIKYAVPIGFNSYKTLVWVPENQKLERLEFSEDERYELKVKK